MARLARAHHVVERAQRLVHRRLGVGVMDLVEVHVVGAEAAQRALDGVEDMLARGAAVPGPGTHGTRALGGDHEVVAAAPEPPAQNLFGAARGVEGAAQRIDVGGVEEGDPARGRPVEDGDRDRLVALEPERHGTETEAGELKTRAGGGDMAHGTPRVAGMPAIGKWVRPAPLRQYDPARESLSQKRWQEIQDRGLCSQGMAHRKPMVSVLAVALGIAIAQPAWAASPQQVLEAFFGRANAILRSADTESGTEAPRQAIRALVNDVFDYREAAARALGPAWQLRTPTQQAEFVRLFADFIERGYIAFIGTKASVTGGLEIRYLEEFVTGDSAAVATTLLTRNGSDLDVDYFMVRRGGRWMVRDVVVDGMGLVANYRAQFNRILSTGTYADLVARMRGDAPGPPQPVVAAAVAAPVPAPAPRVAQPAPGAAQPAHPVF